MKVANAKKAENNSQWALARTICPSKRKIEGILKKSGIKRGVGHGHCYVAKKFVFSRYNHLSGQEYDKAIKIITEYLGM